MNVNEPMNSGLGNIKSVLFRNADIVRKVRTISYSLLNPRDVHHAHRHMDHGSMCKATIKHIPEKTKIIIAFSAQ